MNDASVGELRAGFGRSDSGAPSVASRTWHGTLELGFALRRGRTVLVRKSHRGPLLVQSPFYPGDGACHVYLLHPPGGLVGGDVLVTAVEAEADTRALITTPAATKFYRCDGRRSAQRQQVGVAPGASVEWLPQESLLFDGAAASSRTRFDLAPGARLLAWESWCLGRPSAGEAFRSGHLRQALEVWVDGTPALIERLSLEGEDTNMIVAPWGLGGFPAWSTVLAYPANDVALAAVRELIDHHDPGAAGRVGATTLGELLVVRAQAAGTRALNGLLHALWATLRPLVLGLRPSPPRIWAT